MFFVKKITLLLFFSFSVKLMFAQVFTGKVLDSETKEGLALVNVYFVELATGTSTDLDGNFFIKHYLPQKIHIRISFIGYDTIEEEIDLSKIKQKEFLLEASHLDLKEVVVSVPFGKLQRENLVNISRRKMQELQQSSPVTLAEAISNIPGVEQNATGVGIGKPIIRGLSGNRVVTFAQGIRIENQQWGDEHGLGIGEVGIETIEVIKGPASMLYGSDALGGVIYFVDERYAKHNSIAGFAQTKFLSNTLGTHNKFGVKLHKEKLKLNIFAAYASNADYKVPNGQRVFNTRFDEKNIKTSLGYNNKNWISNLRYSFLQNNFGITENNSFTKSKTRELTLPFQQIANHNLSLDNMVFVKKSKLNFILGYTANRRKEFEDDANQAALDMDLNTLSYQLKWHSPTLKNNIKIIAGTQGMYQTNKNNGEEILIPDANTFDIGTFVMAHFDWSPIQFQLGLRTDYRSIKTTEIIKLNENIPEIHKLYHSFSYSGAAVYQLGAANFRVNISSGFRSPNTSELLSDGVHEGTNRYEIGNQNLKKENATQFDISFDYENEHFNLFINPFFNNIQHYIYLSPTNRSIGDTPVYEYLQSKANLYGGELGFHYHPHGIHWLHIKSDLSNVSAQDEAKNPLPLIPATKINSELKAELSQSGKVKIKDIFLQHIYKFKQNQVAVFETSSADYHLLNLGMNLEVETKQQAVEINLGVKNLFNVNYINHLSRFKPLEIPNQGINFYLALKVKFEKKLSKEL